MVTNAPTGRRDRLARPVMREAHMSQSGAGRGDYEGARLAQEGFNLPPPGQEDFELGPGPDGLGARQRDHPRTSGADGVDLGAVSAIFVSRVMINQPCRATSGIRTGSSTAGEVTTPAGRARRNRTPPVSPGYFTSLRT
jgi:hypothetical protein